MTITAKINVSDNDVLQALRGFLRKMLENGGIDAILVSCHLAAGKGVMPTLISNPEFLDKADPLAPSFPLNAARK